MAIEPKGSYSPAPTADAGIADRVNRDFRYGVTLVGRQCSKQAQSIEGKVLSVDPFLISDNATVHLSKLPGTKPVCNQSLGRMGRVLPERPGAPAAPTWIDFWSPLFDGRLADK